MYKENPLLVAKAIEDAINLLELAKEQDAKFILASTSSIYNGLPLPWREDIKPKVSDYYTEARYCIERLLELYNKLYGLRGVVLRLFSVYGPREESKGRYANVISQFIWAMLKDKQPIIYGDGEQTRDFIYVSDVVRAFLLAMDYERSEFEIFNVGTGKETSFNELVNLLNKLLGKNIKPKYVPNPIKNYVYQTCASVEKARELLGFEAKVRLEEGVKKTIEYYRQVKLPLS